jgi:predicted dehydrogenase
MSCVQAAAEAEREARREAVRLAREEQMKRDEENENEMKKLREIERKQRKDRRAAQLKAAESAPTPAELYAGSAPKSSSSSNSSTVVAEIDTASTADTATTTTNTTATPTPTPTATPTPVRPLFIAPSIVAPERMAELDATEDAALARAKKRAEERRAKDVARANDPNVPAEERERLQKLLARQNSSKIESLAQITADNDEDAALFNKLQKSARLLSTGDGGIMARVNNLDAISQRLGEGDLDAVMPDSLAAALSSRGLSQAAAAALLLKDDDADADSNDLPPSLARVVAAVAAAPEPAPRNELRVGIIGAGNNTSQRHIPLIKLIDGVRVTHVANRTQESAQQVAKKHGIPNACASPSEILECADVDAVIIGTWPNKHAEFTLAALAHKKHVLCEARMAMDGAEARAMQAAARQQPQLVAQLVPSPYTLELDAGLARYVRDKLGRLVFVRGVACTDAFAATEATAPPTWRANRALSGNNIMSMGIVYEALIRWVGPARTVAALGATVVLAQADMPNVLTLHGNLRKDDAVYQLAFSDAAGLAASNELWLHGTQGTLHVDLAAQRVRFGAKGDATLREITHEIKAGPGWNVERDFVDAIRGKAKVTLTDFDTGVHYMTFTDKVWEAMRTHATVEI